MRSEEIYLSTYLSIIYLSTLLYTYCSFPYNFSVDNRHPFMSRYSWINEAFYSLFNPLCLDI